MTTQEKLNALRDIVRYAGFDNWCSCDDESWDGAGHSTNCQNIRATLAIVMDETEEPTTMTTHAKRNSITVPVAPKKYTLVHLPIELREELRRLAYEGRTTQQEIMLEGIRREVDRRNGKKQGQ